MPCSNRKLGPGAEAAADNRDEQLFNYGDYCRRTMVSAIQLAWWSQILCESRTDRSTIFASVRTLAKHTVASAQLVGPILLVASGAT
eukprot:COSAG02_NODE_3805_length_6204_cov_1.605569_4_plen_87_part_00